MRARMELLRAASLHRPSLTAALDEPCVKELFAHAVTDAVALEHPDVRELTDEAARPGTPGHPNIRGGAPLGRGPPPAVQPVPMYGRAPPRPAPGGRTAP